MKVQLELGVFCNRFPIAFQLMMQLVIQTFQLAPENIAIVC